MNKNRKKYRFGYLVAVLFIAMATAGTYYLAYNRILDRAERNVENVILSQRGLHHYIHQIMHPEFFRAIDGGEISKSYYSPVIFSSSYIIRNMHGLYNQELIKHGHPEIYYKLAAENPRNPVNKADQLESDLIKKFNADRALQRYRSVITLEGKKYIYVAIPYKENNKTCLRCHGKRQDAPLGLQALYPGEGGFNEQEGQIRAIESIRAPLISEYETLHAVLAAVVATALSVLGLYWFNIRLRNEVEEKTIGLQEELQARTTAENELRLQATMLEEEIAERQKTEEALHLAKEMAESANKAKSAFLANMSHELRTPLNGVIGMSQLLSMTGVSEEQQEYLNTLQLSAENLTALISDILDITKIEAEQFQLCHTEYSLRACIKEVITMQQAGIKEKGLTIQSVVSAAVPDTLLGDRVRVMQILANLLSNAVKFTDQGGITFSVTAGERHGSIILLDIAVTDTGIGIEPQLIDYIFNIFTQADESYTRKQGGAGLGLALSRKLAELMGGSITVESKPGKGSTFHLLLPCTVPSRPGTTTDDEGTPDLKPLQLAEGPLSVLIAEDNPANSKYAKKLMEKLGCRVTLAMDGKQAFESWEQGAFDLLLIDIQMPVMNGDEVVRLIREKEAGSHIPIIAVTAHAVQGDRERLLQAGCDGYVAKPFRIESLSAEIRRVMR